MPRWPAKMNRDQARYKKEIVAARALVNQLEYVVSLGEKISKAEWAGIDEVNVEAMRDFNDSLRSALRRIGSL